MAEQQRQSLCPRLIDYLAIVGSRATNLKPTGNGQNPPVQVSFNCNHMFCTIEHEHSIKLAMSDNFIDLI